MSSLPLCAAPCVLFSVCVTKRGLGHSLTFPPAELACGLVEPGLDVELPLLVEVGVRHNVVVAHHFCSALCNKAAKGLRVLTRETNERSSTPQGGRSALQQSIKPLIAVGAMKSKTTHLASKLTPLEKDRSGRGDGCYIGRQGLTHTGQGKEAPGSGRPGACTH